MTQKQFNEKYCNYIGKGWEGLEFDNEQVTDYLDTVMKDLVQLPGFELQQIKLKFGTCRFYFDTQFKNKGLEMAIEQHVEEKVNRLMGDESKLRVQANSPYNDGWTKEFYEKELKRYNAGAREWPQTDSRMDVIGQNGNEGTHYEEDWMDQKYRQVYEDTLKTGMFFEWYPNLSGVWDHDKYAYCHEMEFRKG